jgi:branched-chain amino acid transport system ATP-binding protein
MSNPRLLMLDEPSTGLGPLVVAELHELIERICSAGTTVLLVEQNIKLALSVANYVYIIRNGSIVAEGDPSSFGDQRALFNSYIG